jgi:hypothetical protein
MLKFKRFNQEADEIGAMINGLIRYLKKKV